MNTSCAHAASTPTVSLVIVNYKTLALTKMCLDLLHKTVVRHGIALWVVDNYSADESSEYLRSLDWIHLIERTNDGPEEGHIAHGKALDRVLERTDSDYLFLLHTDTFVFDDSIFSMMLERCLNRPDLAAVGCVEQLDRGTVRTLWRFSSRLCKHHFRRMKICVGLSSREPKPYREVYLKSFFALWNCKLIKQHGLHFSIDLRVPGYTLQDRMIALGYTIDSLAPRTIFSYLDHVQSGTVSAAGGYGKTHRRTKMYSDMLDRLSGNTSKG